MDCTYKKVKDLLNSIPQTDLSVEGELLGIHQAVDNLWVAHRENKGRDEIERKLANVFVCAFATAIKFKVDNLDMAVEKRLAEIKNSPYRGKLKI
ncbi:MAG: hypothetical protein V1688_04700 [bacterium]